MDRGGGLSPWTPGSLGSDLKLWLRPEELDNPNLIKYSEDFSQAPWSTVGATVVSTTVTDKDGGSTAAHIRANSIADYFRQISIIDVDSTTYVVSVWLKRAPGHNGTSSARLRLEYTVGGSSQWTGVPAADWERIYISQASGAAETFGGIRLYPDITTGTEEVYICFMQHEVGTTPTAYKVTGATAAGLVSTWADQSSNGNDATQATQANMPLVQASVLDGRSGALFDSVDDALSLDSAIDLSTGALDVFIVFKKASGSSTDAFMGSATNEYLGVSSVWAVQAVIGGAGTNISASSAISGNTPTLVRIARDGSSNLIAEKNGTDITSGSPSNNGSLQINTIGAALTGLQWDGHLLEIIICGAKLTADQLAKVEAFLSSRYPTLGIA